MVWRNSWSPSSSEMSRDRFLTTEPEGPSFISVSLRIDVWKGWRCSWYTSLIGLGYSGFPVMVVNASSFVPAGSMVLSAVGLCSFT